MPMKIRLLIVVIWLKNWVECKSYRFQDKIPDDSVYITTSNYTKFTSDVINERFKKAKLATKNYIADFITNRFWWKNEKH